MAFYPLISKPCQHELCPNMASAQPAFCFGCDRVLCQVHQESPAHRRCLMMLAPVQKWDLTFETALQDLDLEALHTELRALRPGHSVTGISMPDATDIDDDCHGGLNIHIAIVFDDDVQWMLRLNGYKADHAPFKVLEDVRRSEVATMVTLQSVTPLVARIHGWGMGKLSKTGDPRCLYIIFEKKPGSPEPELFSGREDVPKETKARFIERFVDHSIGIAHLHYTSIGSLTYDDDDNVIVGPYIDINSVSDAVAPHSPGPFKSMQARYLQQIDWVLDCLRRGLIARARPLITYLAHLVARELVNNDADLSKEDECFYIRQPDANGWQYLLENGDLTAVLDWEYANTTCKIHAFSAPEAIFCTNEWALGDNAMTEGELMLCEAYERRGRSDLAECVKTGRKYQRLEGVVSNLRLFLAYNGPNGDPLIIGMLNGLVDAFERPIADSLPKSRDEWIQWAYSRHSDDPGLPRIMELEKTSIIYRSHHNSDHPAEPETIAKSYNPPYDIEKQST